MPDQAAERLLGRLFARWQRTIGKSSARTVALNIAGRDGDDYFATSGKARDQFHATLENAARAGAVSLEWGRFEATHELRRIVLCDGTKLAAFLGQSTASTTVAALDERMTPLLSACRHAWITEVYRHARVRWLRGQSALRLVLPADVEDIYRLFVALCAVADGRHAGVDMRTFSARLLSDSKAMERLRGSFAIAWNMHFGSEHRDANDLLAMLGLEKAPQPILLRGNLVVGSPQTDLSRIRPFFGLPGEALENLRLMQVPDYVLTVENLSSFQRHCREVDDNGFIVFSSGFPNPAVQTLLRWLDENLPTSVPVFHWGDIDARGIEILAFIASLFPKRPITPYLMDRKPWWTERLVTAKERQVLLDIADRNSQARTLALQLEEYGIPKGYEQEAIDPKRPPVAAQGDA